eukprot:gene5722-7117_t
MKLNTIILSLIFLLTLSSCSIRLLNALKIQGSISNLIDPHDYSNSTKWRLTRPRSIGIGWEIQDHKEPVHSISISNDRQYIVSCSNDKVAKFHRILMYPNLYPDWTHLYYGDLYLRGHNNSNLSASSLSESIENLQCILSPDKNQLITLSKSKNEIFIDTFQLGEMDGTSDYKMVISPNGSVLVVIISISKLAIQSKGDREWKVIDLYKNENQKYHEIKDLVFLSDIQQNFMVLTKNGSLLIFNFDKESKDWKLQSHNTTPLPGISQIFSISGLTKCGSEQPKENTIHSLALVDSINTVHIVIVDLRKESVQKPQFKIIRSLPSPHYMEDPNTKGKVLISILANSQLLSIQYPGPPIIYIYSSIQNYDYFLHSVIELPYEMTSIQMYSLKYNYLIGSVKGYLAFFREKLANVPKCDPASRTQSFYLDAPPLYDSIDYSSFNLERDGLFPSLTTKPIYYIFEDINSIYPLVISVVALILNLFPILNLIQRITSQRIQEYIFYVIVAVIFGLSIFEILYQSAFTNDWPAHIHHIEQWINKPNSPSILGSGSSQQLVSFKNFDFDYNHFMHYHGPCTYPAGFLYFYGFLYLISFGGSLQIFQVSID